MGALTMAESPNNWTDPSALVGGGGLLAILAAGVKTLLDWRRDKGQQRASSEDMVRDDLMKTIADQRTELARLSTRCDLLNDRMDAARDRENAVLAANAELRSENRAVRDRYHRLTNYISVLLATIDAERRERNLPPFAGIPAWIDEPIPGPTSTQIPPETNP